MCGIVGWVGFDRDISRQREIVEAMTDTMRYRGPDDAGTYIADHVGLGHRRLAIIDLPLGRQPMTLSTPAGELAIVYSGETYNFRELRAELSGLGHRFTTESDTEVVLHGYLQWGPAVAERLNGMYAFAVWDARTDQLVMVRDRLGIKPFYYSETDDGVVFGSEPKALLANPLVPGDVDADGLRELFAMTKKPGWSLWKRIREVEPGTIVTVDRRGCSTRTYWQLPTHAHDDDLDTTVDHVRELMTDIVERQLIADVPRCVLLSGGLDSSALTGLAAAKLHAEGERVHSYSVDFTDQEANFTPDGMRDTPDSPFIRDVAGRVDSLHRDVVLDAAELTDPDVRRAVVAARDIPAGLGDMDNSLLLLFKAIREQSTVALSGESADEVFGGYRWFFDETSRNAETFPWLAFSGTQMDSRSAMLTPHVREVLDLDRYIADEYSTALAGIPAVADESDVERRMRVICHLHLTRFVRMLLDRKDRTSMAVGLEVRVPFCDHRLVEYVYNTPWAFKTFDGREKSLLRAATRHVLPQSVIDRTKSPYPSTQDLGYTEALQKQLSEIAGDDSDLFGIVERDAVRAMCRADAATVSGELRNQMDRVLDLYHWFDIYKPTVDVA
ncbi:asparagine synthase (glutamine-hydrolyzing) [Gordonia liuliyuniae]|uniref:asparagine synthase (glutamine-hydrolyzing) n=1 Tax=Gordonia liuliyuniae TaxID=2911517 RepID=A0ABS9INS8_9ACTN|nr:asparagine synthase (glutamine-hydrolyzing) [Gordonia liuliyuniae]MCF8587194.1 asparagine synthase (glutamine-hydrolyzing) [Gordonia liuliyuniae]